MKKELNLFALINTTLVRHYRTLLIVGLLVTIGAVVYMFSLPRYYTSGVQVIPETKRLALPGNLADMASIAGINTSSMNGDDAINPEIYPDIFKSTNFLVDVLHIEVAMKDSTRVSYYEYVMKHQPMTWWERWLPADSLPQRLPPIDLKRLTREQEELLKTMQANIQCVIDKKTGMIDLRVTAFDPSVAASLADGIMAKLQGYITDYRTSKVRTDLAYSEALAAKAKADYETAQKAYVSYSDSHQDVVLSEHQRRITELENEMQLQYQQYQQLQQQKITLQAKLQERIPAFTVIQSATIPTRPAGPKRVFGVLGIVALVMFGVSVGLAIHELKKWNKQPLAPSVEHEEGEVAQEDEA